MSLVLPISTIFCTENEKTGLPPMTCSGIGGKRRRSGTDEQASLRGCEACGACADEAACTSQRTNEDVFIGFPTATRSDTGGKRRHSGTNEGVSLISRVPDIGAKRLWWEEEAQRRIWSLGRRREGCGACADEPRRTVGFEEGPGPTSPQEIFSKGGAALL